MEIVKRYCDICGKNISDSTGEKYASIIIGIFEKEHCCENCREAVDNFINKRKEYFSDKNNFNM